MKSFYLFVLWFGLCTQSMAFVSAGASSGAVSSSSMVSNDYVNRNSTEDLLESNEEFKKWKILKELYKNATSVEERKQLHQQMRTLLGVMSHEQRQALKQVLQERVKEHWEKMTPHKEVQSKIQKVTKDAQEVVNEEDPAQELESFIGLMP